jgi:hypothetical protein
MVKTPILGNLDLRALEVAANDRTLPRVVRGRGLSGHDPPRIVLDAKKTM